MDVRWPGWVFAVLILALVQKVQAQDPHFSQYFASPLSLNPANTGFFDGDTRVSFNNRQQWFNVGSNYTTTSISADTKILADAIPEDDIFAVGLMGLFDSSLGGVLQSNYAAVSTAYHKSLGYQDTHMLTLGAQLSFANLYVDYSKLSFASQFDGFGFNTSVPVYALSSNSSAKYFDLNIGLLYAAHLPGADLYAGGSLYHLLKPSVALFSSSDQLPRRFTAQGGADIHLAAGSSILVSGLFMAQSTARDEMIGAAYALRQTNSDKNFNMYFGMWLRLNESFIPYVGADYGSFSAGLSYDSSYNTNYNYKPSTVELSLTFRGKRGNKVNSPRF